MRKGFKRVLCLVMAFVMVAGAVPVTAQGGYYAPPQDVLD